MPDFVPLLLVAAATGSGLVAGLLFAFSVAVMPALTRQPDEHGLRVMQTINVVILNPLFLGVFMGTAILAAAIAVVAVVLPGRVHTAWALAGAVLYLAGTFGITMFANVPLNNRLAALDAKDVSSAAVWRMYLARWTRWNHVRTAAGALAAAAWMVAMLYQAGAAVSIG